MILTDHTTFCASRVVNRRTKMTFREHTQFRTTKVWKEFRKKLLADRGTICECCGTRHNGKQARQLQIHHKDPENYTDLTPEKFAVLDSSCHDLVERYAIKLRGSKSGDIPSLELWIQLLYKFLPYRAREAVIQKYDEYLLSKLGDIWIELKQKA